MHNNLVEGGYEKYIVVVYKNLKNISKVYCCKLFLELEMFIEQIISANYFINFDEQISRFFLTVITDLVSLKILFI